MKPSYEQLEQELQKLMALVAALTGRFHLAKREALLLIQDLYGIEISEGSIINIEENVAVALEVIYEKIHQCVIKGVMPRHFDETSWRDSGKRCYVWLATTATAAFYRIDPHRSKEAFFKVIGCHTEQPSVTDRYGAYNTLDGPHQYCLAHLIRDFHAFAEQSGESGKIGGRIEDELRAACHIQGRWHDGEITKQQRGICLAHNNPLIRFPCAEGPKTIEELNTLYPQEADQMVNYDHTPQVQKELLSLSPFLFSNILIDGESTWHFFLNNRSVSPPSVAKYFDLFCNHFGLHFSDDQKKEFFLIEFQRLHGELLILVQRYITFQYPKHTREQAEPHGILLQIMVPSSLVDKVCYPAKAYGFKDAEISSVSTQLQEMRTNPTKHPNLQIRMLAQSLLVPDHNITVYIHGAADFFKATPANYRQSPHYTVEDSQAIKKMLADKLMLFAEMRQLMQRMILEAKFSQ